MPFSDPWRTYCAGDFFYGFSGSRGRLIQQLTQRTCMDFASKNTVAWLDQLLTGTAVNDCHYLNKDFSEFCRTREKYHGVVRSDADLEVPAADDDVANNRRWRKKSKAGIEFLVKHNHFIHFAIDHGMDWNAVISKPGVAAEEAVFPFARSTVYQYKVDDDIKYRVITYAEIRFIFRNRSDQDFMKRIQFWYQNSGAADSGFSPGVPPWEKEPEIWANYTPSGD